MAGKGSTLPVWSGSEEFLLFFAIDLVCCGGVFIILARNLCKTLRLAIVWADRLQSPFCCCRSRRSFGLLDRSS